jgi:hypothetical protein
MKKRIIIAVCFAILFVTAAFIYNYRIPLMCRFLTIFNDTVYADGYSEKKYEKIQLGITTQEVFRLIGRPLYELDLTQEGGTNGPDHACYWTKSKSGDGDYFFRSVFFQDGKVSKKLSYYYVD